MAEVDKAPAALPDVKVIVDGEPLQTGQWKSGLFGCFDSLVPNCLCSCCCPCVSLGQIVARLGIADFLTTVLAVFVLNLTGFGYIVVFFFLWYLRTKFRATLQIPGSLIGDCCASFCCGCCVIAQIATHTGSYTPGSCSFGPKSTLPGYSTMLQSKAQPAMDPPASKV